MAKPRASLEQWSTLQAVIDHGGFAQAASALHRSQSSVSYNINRLQEALGVSLLRIDGRKAVLTEAGQILLRQARQLTDHALALEALACNIEKGWEAELHLAVDAAYPKERLMAALRAFMPLSKGCKLTLSEEILSGSEELLLSGKADIIVSTLKINGYLPVELDLIEFVAVAHPEHPLHKYTGINLEHELTQHLQVVLRDSGRINPRDMGWLHAQQRWTVTNFETAIHFVSNGLGFAWLPRHLITAELASGKLKAIKLEPGQVQSHRFYLYTTKVKPLGPAAEILLDSLVHFSKTPGVSKFHTTN
ncbi:LysR family transcriptional regulator [Pseudomonas sp. F1_0610]|uniref:LysR family transcriptional regulator n=1 Tax=Pseudomonas sp. F1_0610 TaxID=3114284 RepID=UPI0039C4CA90